MAIKISRANALIAAAQVELEENALGRPVIVSPDRDPAPVPPAHLLAAEAVQTPPIAAQNRLAATARLKRSLGQG